MTAQEVNELQGLCNAYCDSADPNAVLNLGISAIACCTDINLCCAIVTFCFFLVLSLCWG